MFSLAGCWLWFTNQIHSVTRLTLPINSFHTNYCFHTYYYRSARRQYSLLWPLNIGVVKGCGFLSRISIQKSWQLRSLLCLWTLFLRFSTGPLTNSRAFVSAAESCLAHSSSLSRSTSLLASFSDRSLGFSASSRLVSQHRLSTWVLRDKPLGRASVAVMSPANLSPDPGQAPKCSETDFESARLSNYAQITLL
jgi:hypothetical protein